jgi:hypothetical protein
LAMLYFYPFIFPVGFSIHKNNDFLGTKIHLNLA